MLLTGRPQGSPLPNTFSKDTSKDEDQVKDPRLKPGGLQWG